MEKRRLDFDDPEAALAERPGIDDADERAIHEEIGKMDSDTLDSG